MSELHFAEPQWVHALWLVLAAGIALVLLERRGGQALGRFVGPLMQPRLVLKPTALRRWLRIGLLVASAASLVVALMRPQWGIEFVTAPRVGAEIMIALDVSRSMLAEDVAPNRLERAKAELRDLLPYLEGDQVGLIAFAGRASVLSPLTPDFSFLRLVLDNVDAGSVRPGGTRLEEPIRKAVAGFGGQGDLSRVLLLITDGEDHDSFPLDAAKEAAERGIHILAIGFGDENGAELVVTNPATGAREVIRDADGRPVVSRLDGDLLRELAMSTDGAYVPAGTGVLDLESIFEAHIRPLMRATGDERGKTVRKDAFQWALMAALLALIGSVATQGARARALLCLLLFLPTALPEPALAQPATAPAAPHATTNGPSAAAIDAAPDGVPDDAAAETRARLVIPEDPREAFNAGLAAFSSGRLDGAERLFEAARNRARSDGEVRFRATYDLAWVAVRRAEAQRESDPEQALAELERGADWFREAVALRPNNEDARRNLEIVLQRILALADLLAEREPGDVDARLDALIEAQREIAGATRRVVDLVQASSDPNATDSMRPRFKQVAVEERKQLSQARLLADLAGKELDTLEATPEPERTPEDQMRAAQLKGLLHYLHRARERMGQARSQLRQRQAERAHRRAIAGLSALKRAKEQLLDPVRVLDGLLADARQVAQETRALAALRMGLAAAGSETPAWLSPGYLAETQDEVGQRTEEVRARLAAGLDEAATVQDPEQIALLERIAEAEPFVAEAGRELAAAHAALEAERIADAMEPQSRALTALASARERFLDLTGLIELAHADERRIRSMLSPQAGPEGEASSSDPAEAEIAEYGQALSDFQRINLERVRRMEPMITRERDTLLEQKAALREDDAEAETERTAIEQGLERLQVADGILALTESTMSAAVGGLADLVEAPSRLDENRQRVDSIIRGLESLRRLFFTLIQHIRDTARQQIELGDDTEETAAEADAARRSERTAAVRERQQALAALTEKLADALHEQSFQDPAALPQATGDGGGDPAAAEEARLKLVQASELVLAASDEMKAAAEGLAGEARDFEGVRSDQGEAVEKLAEALAVLQPPQEKQDQEQQQAGREQERREQQGQDEGQEGQQDGEQQQAGAAAEEQDRQAASDPSQMLQGVRDREAERHREQGERTHRGYDPVEKDW